MMILGGILLMILCIWLVYQFFWAMIVGGALLFMIGFILYWTILLSGGSALAVLAVLTIIFLIGKAVTA
jgi:hypothetical protein